jgi:hypothetical protein
LGDSNESLSASTHNKVEYFGWESIAAAGRGWTQSAQTGELIRRSHGYMCVSRGPDITWSEFRGVLTFSNTNCHYDPTNGTISAGDIVMSDGRLLP